jgi:hypothetical protein
VPASAVSDGPEASRHEALDELGGVTRPQMDREPLKCARRKATVCQVPRAVRNGAEMKGEAVIPE